MTTSIANRFCRKLVMLFRGASAATSPRPCFLKTRQRSSLAFHFPLLGDPQEIHLRNSLARLADSQDRRRITRSVRCRLCHWVHVPPLTIEVKSASGPRIVVQ